MNFEIVKRYEYGNGEDIRMIKKGEDYGIQTTKTIEPTWGYTKEGAERTYNRMVEAANLR